jgi:hypothetical protein
MPTMPPPTCPLIDAVMQKIMDAIKELRRAERHTQCELSSDAMNESAAILEDIGELETIRSHNAMLRDAAEYYMDQCEHIQSELDSAKGA